MNIDSNVAKEVLPTLENSGNHLAKRLRKRSHPISPTTTTLAPAKTPAKKSIKPPVMKLKPAKDLGDLGLGSSMVISPVIHSCPTHNTRPATKLCTNVQLNPSILGGKLLLPQQTLLVPQPTIMSLPSSRISTSSNNAHFLNFYPSRPAYKSSRRTKAATLGCDLLRGRSLLGPFLRRTANHMEPLVWDLVALSHSLGAEGVLLSRQIESFLRVFKQLTHTLPSRQVVGYLSICPPL